MRKLLFIFAIFLSSGIFAQLPQANQAVLDYAKSKIGKRVGSGICFNLVDSALCKVNPKWKDGKYKNDIAPYGEKVKLKDVMPGDIFYEDRGAVAASHVSIVVEANGTHLKVLNQNVNAKKLKDSKVVYSLLDVSEANKWQLKFYRPKN